VTRATLVSLPNEVLVSVFKTKKTTRLCEKLAFELRRVQKTSNSAKIKAYNKIVSRTETVSLQDNNSNIKLKCHKTKLLVII
jgi:hypothetical protein